MILILNDNDIDFEYDNEAFKTYKNFFLQDMYCDDDTSDDEDILPIQSLDSSSTVNNTNQERNNVYSTCILIDLVDGKIQTCED